MTYKINAIRIFQRIVNKFQLTLQGAIAQFTLSDNVQLVSNVDQLLSIPRIIVTTGLDSSTTGVKTIATVPAGKRYRVLVADASRTAGSSALASSFAVNDGTNTIGFYSATAASNINSGTLNQPMVLEPGWIIGVNISTAEGASTFQGKIFYEEEDAY